MGRLRPLSTVHASVPRSPLCPQGHKKFPSEKLSRIPELIEPWFIFALVWSVGATSDNQSRLAFSQWLRIKMDMGNVRGGTAHFFKNAPRLGPMSGDSGVMDETTPD